MCSQINTHPCACNKGNQLALQVCWPTWVALVEPHTIRLQYLYAIRFWHHLQVTSAVCTDDCGALALTVVLCLQLYLHQKLGRIQTSCSLESVCGTWLPTKLGEVHELLHQLNQHEGQVLRKFVTRVVCLWHIAASVFVRPIQKSI